MVEQATNAKKGPDLKIIVGALHRLEPDQLEQVIASVERPARAPQPDRIEATIRGWAAIIVGERIKRAAPRGYEMPTTEGMPRNTSQDFELVEGVLTAIGGSTKTLSDLLLHVYWYERELGDFRLFPMEQAPASDYAVPAASDYRALNLPVPASPAPTETEAKRISAYTQINQVQPPRLPERVKALGLTNQTLVELALDRFMKLLTARVAEFDRDLRNKRADKERARRISAARSEAGRKGAETKWKRQASG